MTSEAWIWIGTTAATLLFIVVPGLLLAWYVLEQWIGGRESYDRIVSEYSRR